MEIRETSAKGIQFLIQEEGLIKRPYKDQAGIPTIGIGCTYYEDGTKVKMTDPAITTERAILLFRNLLKVYELGVYSVTRDDINHNQFDAMTSLCFNIGVYGFKGSTLVKNVNKDRFNPVIRENFKSWKNATINGKKKPVLLARRKREAELYFTPIEELVKTPEQIYIDHVKHIQTKLGLDPKHIIGVFGPITRAAVIAFQKKNKLDVDGVVGRETLAALNKL